MSGTIFKPPVYTCLVKGCENESDPGSTQCLCRMCYDVITTGDVLKYHANYMGKNWISDTVSKIVHLQQDKRDLQDEVDVLKMDIKEAYILKNDDVLSLNDLRRFYRNHQDDAETIKRMRKEVDALNYNIYENVMLKKENEALKERIKYLEDQITALLNNIDHAYNLGDGRFLTLDDLHDFYEDNKKVHNLVESLRNKIVLLELQLKQLQKPKNEDFATNTEDKLAERAKINQEKQNVKFEGYTEGFWKGFDLGYSKARDQFYE